MKRKTGIAAIAILCTSLVITTSCASNQPVTHDNGNHNGWYKNPNNPHHPETTKEKNQSTKPEKTKRNKTQL